MNENTPIPPPDWEALIEEIANDMMIEHTPAQILKIRAKLYDLLTHCIPASQIIKVSIILPIVYYNIQYTNGFLVDIDV